MFRQARINHLIARMEKLIARSPQHNGYLLIEGMSPAESHGMIYGWPRILKCRMSEADANEYIALLRQYADLSWAMTAVDQHDYDMVLKRLEKAWGVGVEYRRLD